jgi:hypothetical protein
VTRSEVKTQVRTGLDEATANFWTDEDLNDSIQDCYDLSTVMTATIEKSMEINLQANLTYYDLRTLIPDFYSVFAVYNPQTRLFLDPSSELLARALRPDWELATGQPRGFFPLNFRYIAIYPRPVVTQGTLKVMYRAAAPTLTSDSTSFLTPQELDPAFEEYVIGDLMAQQVELVKYSRRMQSYLVSLGATKSRQSGRQLPDRLFQLSRGFER